MLMGAGIMSLCPCVRLCMQHSRSVRFVSKTRDFPCHCLCPVGGYTWMNEPSEGGRAKLGLLVRMHNHLGCRVCNIHVSIILPLNCFVY